MQLRHSQVLHDFHAHIIMFHTLKFTQFVEFPKRLAAQSYLSSVMYPVLLPFNHDTDHDCRDIHHRAASLGSHIAQFYTHHLTEPQMRAQTCATHRVK